MKKLPYRKKLFIDTCEINLPLYPVITRWGTWLEVSFFYCENFSIILEFIKKLSQKNNKNIHELKKLVEDPEVFCQISSLKKYKFLTESIEKGIKRDLNVIQQFDIIEKVEKILEGAPLVKLKKSLEKNSNLRNFIKNIKTNLNCDQTFLYSPLTTIDVDRSFSKFKYLITDGRNRLSEKNVEQYSYVYVNNFL